MTRVNYYVIDKKLYKVEMTRHPIPNMSAVTHRSDFALAGSFSSENRYILIKNRYNGDLIDFQDINDFKNYLDTLDYDYLSSYNVIEKTRDELVSIVNGRPSLYEMFERGNLSSEVVLPSIQQQQAVIDYTRIQDIVSSRVDYSSIEQRAIRLSDVSDEMREHIRSNYGNSRSVSEDGSIAIFFDEMVQPAWSFGETP